MLHESVVLIWKNKGTQISAGPSKDRTLPVELKINEAGIQASIP